MEVKCLQDTSILQYIHTNLCLDVSQPSLMEIRDTVTYFLGCVSSESLQPYITDKASPPFLID